MGIWEKPLAIEVEPKNDRDVQALAQRGWRVKVFAERFSADNGKNDGHRPPLQPGFPDLEMQGASREEFQHLLEQEDGKIDQVRFGAWEDPADWLEGSRVAPEYLVLKGGMDAEEVDRVRALGYAHEARLMSGEWPAGGPLPRALDFHKCKPGTGIGPGEDLYLRMGEKIEERRSGDRLSLGEKPERPRLKDAKRIGVCVIATANYRMYITPLLRSIRKNFLPGHEVTVFLFTDGEVADTPDLRVIGKVGEEILGELVGVIHPGFHDKPREKFTYERRAESTARVSPEEGIHYYCGAFQGGTTASYLQAACEMAERIDADEARGITAAWHDESHWNRYLIDYAPNMVLSPSYCWYPDGRSKDFEGKISVVLKDASLMRQGGRAGC